MLELGLLEGDGFEVCVEEFACELLCRCVFFVLTALRGECVCRHEGEFVSTRLFPMERYDRRADALGEQQLDGIASDGEFHGLVRGDHLEGVRRAGIDAVGHALINTEIGAVIGDEAEGVFAGLADIEPSFVGDEEIGLLVGVWILAEIDSIDDARPEFFAIGEFALERVVGFAALDAVWMIEHAQDETVSVRELADPCLDRPEIVLDALQHVEAFGEIVELRIECRPSLAKGGCYLIELRRDALDQVRQARRLDVSGVIEPSCAGCLLRFAIELGDDFPDLVVEPLELGEVSVAGNALSELVRLCGDGPQTADGLDAAPVEFFTGFGRIDTFPGLDDGLVTSDLIVELFGERLASEPGIEETGGLFELGGDCCQASMLPEVAGNGWLVILHEHVFDAAAELEFRELVASDGFGAFTEITQGGLTRRFSGRLFGGGEGLDELLEILGNAIGQDVLLSDECPGLAFVRVAELFLNRFESGEVGGDAGGCLGAVLSALGERLFFIADELVTPADEYRMRAAGTSGVVDDHEAEIEIGVGSGDFTEVPFVGVVELGGLAGFESFPDDVLAGRRAVDRINDGDLGDSEIVFGTETELHDPRIEQGLIVR